MVTDPQHSTRFVLATAEYLQKVTVGELKQLNSTISIVDYDLAWPSLFERQAARIRTALGDMLFQIEHVGSTSVPELAAKPIIDIVLVVPNSADEAAYVPALEAAGYVLRVREPEWHEHRMFKGASEAVNLHCFSQECPEVARMLTFRDWLRNNEQDRLLYERAKRELACKTWKYVQNYADAKSAVVEQILARAKNEVQD